MSGEHRDDQREDAGLQAEVRHLDDESLLDLLLGDEDDAGRDAGHDARHARAQAHLTRCGECRVILERMTLALSAYRAATTERAPDGILARLLLRQARTRSRYQAPATAGPEVSRRRHAFLGRPRPTGVVAAAMAAVMLFMGGVWVGQNRSQGGRVYSQETLRSPVHSGTLAAAPPFHETAADQMIGLVAVDTADTGR
jgi:hypothetical protein